MDFFWKKTSHGVKKELHCMYYTLFYKNKLNIRTPTDPGWDLPKNWEQVKNSHQAEILILYTDWDAHLLLELAGSSDAGRVINKLVKFADAVLTVSCFSHTAGWNQSKHVFLVVIAPFYCPGQQIHCLETSGNKNNLRTIWGWNRQEIKNNPGSAESYWFLYKKKRVMSEKHYTLFFYKSQ